VDVNKNGGGLVGIVNQRFVKTGIIKGPGRFDQIALFACPGIAPGLNPGPIRVEPDIIRIPHIRVIVKINIISVECKKIPVFLAEMGDLHQGRGAAINASGRVCCGQPIVISILLPDMYDDEEIRHSFRNKGLNIIFTF